MAQPPLVLASQPALAGDLIFLLCAMLNEQGDNSDD